MTGKRGAQAIYTAGEFVSEINPAYAFFKAATGEDSRGQKIGVVDRVLLGVGVVAGPALKGLSGIKALKGVGGARAVAKGGSKHIR